MIEDMIETTHPSKVGSEIKRLLLISIINLKRYIHFRTEMVALAD